jgi:hypothetical protein
MLIALLDAERKITNLYKLGLIYDFVSLAVTQFNQIYKP